MPVYTNAFPRGQLLGRVVIYIMIYMLWWLNVLKLHQNQFTNEMV